MYCEQCGSFIQDGEAFCTNCGAAAPAAQPAPAPAPGPEPAPGPVVQPIIQAQPAQPVQPVAQPVQPVYQQAQPVQPIYQTPAYQQQGVIITPFEGPKKNTVATVGMIFGIITAALYWTTIFNIIPGTVGIICSCIGLAKKNIGGKGKSIAGLITSIVGILLGILVLAIALMKEDY